jgi:hypothetical protein
MPTLIPNCKKDARVVVDEHAAIRCEQIRVANELTNPHLGGWHRDELMNRQAEIDLLMLQEGVGRGVSLLIEDLEEVTNEPLKAAVDLLVRAAGYKLGKDPIQEVIAGLVDVYGADRLHAAITANSELNEQRR